MTDIEQAAPKPIKKTRKKRKIVKRAPRVAAAPVEKKAKQTFAGLTTAECAIACSPKGCEISGNNCCGHPAKGGLSFINKNDPAALERFVAAQKQLGIAAVDKQFS